MRENGNVLTIASYIPNRLCFRICLYGYKQGRDEFIIIKLRIAIAIAITKKSSLHPSVYFRAVGGTADLGVKMEIKFLELSREDFT